MIVGGVRMKIGIVGGGAIGQFLYVSLKERLNAQIVLFTRTSQQAEILNKQGIVLEHQENTLVCSVFAREISHIESVDVLVFAVKQYALEEALRSCELSGHHFTTYLFLQNGMGHLERIERIPKGNIYVGTVSHGVTRKSVNEITLKGVGPIRLSGFRGRDAAFEQAMLQLNSVAFPVQVLESPVEILREKLYINAVINPLTGLLQVQNGMLKENIYFFRMARRIFEELDEVFSFGEAKERVWCDIVAVIEATAKNESSMLQDLKNGRLTEIDGIYGYIMKEADKQKKTLACIPFVYQAIRGIEKRGK